MKCLPLSPFRIPSKYPFKPFSTSSCFSDTHPHYSTTLIYFAFYYPHYHFMVDFHIAVLANSLLNYIIKYCHIQCTFSKGLFYCTGARRNKMAALTSMTREMTDNINKKAMTRVTALTNMTDVFNI